MKKHPVSSENIHLLNYIFNPGLRTLKKDGNVLQLRKKQSDVLALLCKKYPAPVSQAEFLAEVWGGVYVTSQSIAQMIRSLRISLGDDTKSIIITIPKLGYQLSIEPLREEPEGEPESSDDALLLEDKEMTEAGEVENISSTTQPVTNAIPTCVEVVPDIPELSSVTMPDKSGLSRQTLFVTIASALFVSLVCVAMIARNHSPDFISSKERFTQALFNDLVPSPVNNFLYCCKTADSVICNPKPNLLNSKCSEYGKNVRQ